MYAYVVYSHTVLPDIRKGIGFLGSEVVTGGCKLLCGCWETNTASLKE